MASSKYSVSTFVAATMLANSMAAVGRFKTEAMRRAFLLWFALFSGEALAQRYVPPGPGAAAIGGSADGGGGDSFLSSPLGIMVTIVIGIWITVITVQAVFALLRWLSSLPGVFLRRLRQILER